MQPVAASRSKTRICYLISVQSAPILPNGNRTSVIDFRISNHSGGDVKSNCCPATGTSSQLHEGKRGWTETMLNPGLPTSLWAQLEGKLWHATGNKGLAGIVTDGQIKVSTVDRYQNSIFRCRGCVSLFDFGQESDDQDDFMRSNWFPWLGRE